MDKLLADIVNTFPLGNVDDDLQGVFNDYFDPREDIQNESDESDIDSDKNEDVFDELTLTSSGRPRPNESVTIKDALLIEDLPVFVVSMMHNNVHV